MKSLTFTFLCVGVTCRQLGYENGVSICCGAYGYLYSQSLAERIQCRGNETKLHDCKFDNPFGSCSVDYAAVACYNGSLTASKYNLSYYLNKDIPLLLFTTKRYNNNRKTIVLFFMQYRGILFGLVFFF